MSNSTEEQYLYKKTIKGRAFHPLIEIGFHTEKALYHARSGTTNKYREELNPNDHILSVTTQKTLNNAAGMFTMTLVGTQWASYVRAQDVVTISMGYMGEKTLKTVMVGLVDKVNRKRSIGGDGKPSVNTVITGRDFGKLFVKDLLKFYPEISGKNASNFFLTDVGWVNLMKVFTTDNIMKGTPAVIIDNVMRHIFPKVHDVSWNMWDESTAKPKSKKVNVKQVIRYSLGKLDFFMPFIFTADQYEGALWNLFERASPKPFTELFIDTRNHTEAFRSSFDQRVVPHTVEKDSAHITPWTFGRDKAKVVLVLRETPYDSVHKKRLVRHRINEEDVISDDLTISDEEHYNLFWAGTTINPLGIDLKRVAPPMLNETNAKKYGLAPMEVNIEGMEIKDKMKLEGMSKTYTGKLKEWYQNNHKYWSGTLEVRGKADIRVGQMVEYGHSEAKFVLEYYVEGVSQNFTVFQGWTTTLTLTRGMKPGTVVDSSKHEWKPPSPPPPPKKPAAKPATYYKVVRGDTLWHISKRKYGDPLKWRKIWEANKTMLIKRDRRNASDHGHWIYPGQKLTIPPK